MAEYPGNATEEDIKNQAVYELRQQLAGITEDRMVSVSPALAALLLELLPEVDEEEVKKKMQEQPRMVQAPEAQTEESEEDDDDDTSSPASRRAPPRHRK